MKYYDEIVKGIRSFFAWSDETTDAEVADKLSQERPLSEQLSEAASDERFNTLETSVNELQDKFSELQEKYSDLEALLAAKDARISELESQLNEAQGAHASEMEQLKAQHTKEVKALASELASLKAGVDRDENGYEDDHEAGKIGQSNATNIVAVKSDTLKSLLTRQEQ